MELPENTDEIIVGTNEEFILGFSVQANEDGRFSFQPSFTNHSHTGRVKQVAIGGKFLVSGSTDEFMRIFNLKNRKEVGFILPHDGTVTCLQFHDSGFLFSGSEDGNIGLFKKGKWQLVKKLKGHKAGVTGLAIHPTGKLALSIGKDKRIVTWDLMKGKRVHIAGSKKPGDFISWSPTGSHYLIAMMNILNIYDVETANISHSIDFKENILCFCYITPELLVIGGEKKNLALFNLDTREELMSWEVHENRTKALILMQSESERTKNLVSASSDGFIKVWSIDLLHLKTPPSLVGKVDTKCRIICMALHSSPKESHEDRIEQSLLDYAAVRKVKRTENFAKYKAKKEAAVLSAQMGGNESVEMSPPKMKKTPKRKKLSQNDTNGTNGTPKQSRDETMEASKQPKRKRKKGILKPSSGEGGSPLSDKGARKISSGMKLKGNKKKFNNKQAKGELRQTVKNVKFKKKLNKTK